MSEVGVYKINPNPALEFVRIYSNGTRLFILIVFPLSLQLIRKK